jgi:hypothetical protein
MPDWLLPVDRQITVPVDRYRRVCMARDSWPEGWPDIWRRAGFLSRSDIFDVAARWREQQAPARHVLGATLAWGFGNTNYGGKRTELILAPTDLDRRLATGLTPLANRLPTQQNLLEAYRAFNRGPAQLPWFRAPFFTKLLYLSGYRRGEGGLQPLILDSVVGHQLPSEVAIRRPIKRHSPAWTAREWLAYLEWAAAQGTEPDHVEIQLFARGSQPN